MHLTHWDALMTQGPMKVFFCNKNGGLIGNKSKFYKCFEVLTEAWHPHNFFFHLIIGKTSEIFTMFFRLICGPFNDCSPSAQSMQCNLHIQVEPRRHQSAWVTWLAQCAAFLSCVELFLASAFLCIHTCCVFHIRRMICVCWAVKCRASSGQKKSGSDGQESKNKCWLRWIEKGAE